jgi:hypothetical protein
MGGGSGAMGGGSGSPQPDGAPCTADAQCQGNLCLTEAAYGFPRGMCSGTCSGLNTGCHGGYCSPGGHCYASCTGTGLPSACRAGFACQNVDGTKMHNMCVALCQSDSECSGTGAGYGCNPWSGYCESKDKGLSKTGAACGSGVDCESGICLLAFPGGYCAGNCRGDTKKCASDGYCRYTSTTGDNLGTCEESCSTLGAVCRSEQGAAGPFDYQCFGDSSGSGKFCTCKFGYADGVLEPCSSNRQCCSGSCGNVYISGNCD